MDLIKHPSVVLITGRRRSGKSCLGYYLLEKFYKERNIPCFVVSLPKEKHHLLPDFIKPIDTVENLPEDCIALIDEGSLSHHAHLWRQKETVVMDRIISVSGQKKQTFIFITHTMRKLAVGLVLEIDLLLCKKPSLLHSKLERSEVRKLIEEVSTEFRKLPKDEVKKNTYIISEDYKGFIRNSMPSFFTQELSEAFAGIPLENINNNKNDKRSMTEEEDKPLAVTGGLKIWFRPEDRDKVLDIVKTNKGERLANESIFSTAGKSHLNFDLSQIIKGTKRNPAPTGRYRLSSGRFDMERIISRLKAEGISHAIDTESGKPIYVGGEVDVFYPVDRDDIALRLEEEEPVEIHEEPKEDKLAEYAKKLKL